MEKPSYEELQVQLKKAQEEIERLKNENSALQAKLLEVQWMINKYIMKD